MLYNSQAFAINTKSPNLPTFSKISIEHLEQDLDLDLANYRQVIKTVTSDAKLPSWDNVMQPMEDASVKLENLTNVVSHLNSTKDSEPLRKVYSNILPKLSNFSAELLQNKQLQQKVLAIKNSTEFSKLHFAQQKIIDNLLLDFRLAGINLNSVKQARYREITEQLSKLSEQFSKNVLDATQSWSYHIPSKDERQLQGLPKHVIELAKQAAAKKGLKEGWLLTLDLPTVSAILQHAASREIREKVYTAYVTRASDQFFDKKFDNTKVMEQIVALRSELATMLGFANYSDYSLAHKMAKSTQEVVDFLEELATKSVPIAKKEFAALEQFALQQDKISQLQPWDVSYYAERQKEHLFTLSEEELREYFPLDKALAGVFDLANSLYGITIAEVNDFDRWDPAVKLYKVVDQDNKLRGYFYMDLYVRDHKQSGAWMANCLSRHKLANGELQHPVAFLVTNFTKPTAKGSFLYHDELHTLLHEFGHTLHHILTQVDYVSVSGCNGVSWDAVELPSQFMEKWSYDWDFLQQVSEHSATKQKISRQIFDSLIGIKNYQAGMFMARQLEFAMFDFKLHLAKNPPNIQQMLNQVREQVTVVPVVLFNRFQHSFSHIFAGGYDAGYYSYNWAEVLASDAYMAWHEDKSGADLQLKSKLGKQFLQNILEMGGSKDAIDLYIAFRNKQPSIESLLAYKGLTSE